MISDAADVLVRGEWISVTDVGVWVDDADVSTIWRLSAARTWASIMASSVSRTTLGLRNGTRWPGWSALSGGACVRGAAGGDSSTRGCRATAGRSGGTYDRRPPDAEVGVSPGDSRVLGPYGCDLVALAGALDRLPVSFGLVAALPAWCGRRVGRAAGRREVPYGLKGEESLGGRRRRYCGAGPLKARRVRRDCRWRTSSERSTRRGSERRSEPRLRTAVIDGSSRGGVIRDRERALGALESVVRERDEASERVDCDALLAAGSGLGGTGLVGRAARRWGRLRGRSGRSRRCRVDGGGCARASGCRRRSTSRAARPRMAVRWRES